VVFSFAGISFLDSALDLMPALTSPHADVPPKQVPPPVWRDFRQEHRHNTLGLAPPSTTAIGSKK